MIDSNLTFNEHLTIICKNASQKVAAISIFCHIISENKRIILLETFLNINLTTVHWFGCFAIKLSIGKLIDSMKGHWDLRILCMQLLWTFGNGQICYNTQTQS